MTEEWRILDKAIKKIHIWGQQKCKQDWKQSLTSWQSSAQAWYHKAMLPGCAKAFSSAACFLWTVISFFFPPDFSVCCIASDRANLDSFSCRCSSQGSAEGTGPWHRTMCGPWTLFLTYSLFPESFTLLKDFTNWIIFKSCADAVPLWLNDIRIFKKTKK